MASWLVRLSPDRAVRAQALAGDIMLCSWATIYSHSASIRRGEFNAGRMQTYGYQRTSIGKV